MVPPPGGIGERSRRRAPRRKGAPGRAKKARGLKHVAMTRAVCAITDPFCPAAKNARWPDGSGGNTMTVQLRGHRSPTNNASGNVGIVFVPLPPYGYADAAEAAGVYTVAGGWVLMQTNSLLAQYATRCRVVSFGVIARCIGSAINSGGLLTLGTVNEVAVTQAFTVGTELFNSTRLVPLAMGTEVSWVSQPCGAGAHDFVAQGVNNGLSADWTNLVCLISGGAASVAAVDFEWYMNCEFCLSSQSALAPVVPPNPPPNRGAIAGSNTVSNKIGGFIQGGVDVVEKTIANAANAFVAGAIEELASGFALLGL